MMGCQGCNQGSHSVSKKCISVCANNKCHFRVKVPCVEIGMDGMMPPNGNGGTREFAIYLASDEALPDGNYIGLGTDGGDFIRNTVVIPANAIITGLVFNIRDNPLGAGEVATAQIVISQNCGFGEPTPTGIIASVTGPNAAATPNCCGSATAAYPINQCTLLSVQVSTGNGAFPSGAAATVLYTIPS